VNKAGVVAVFQSRRQNISAAVFAAFYILTGLGLFLGAGSPGFPGDPVCLILIATGLFIGVQQMGNRITLTSDSVRDTHLFRTRATPLSAITSYGVGRARSVGNWSVLVAHTDAGPVRMRGIMGSRSYVEAVIVDLQYLTYTDQVSGHRDSR
jgi:hypothetical protein